jgi:hypothetical protein
MSRYQMTQEHVARIAVAQDHHGLCVVAKEILELLADPAGMVCGPISTGGLGSVEANIQHFNKAIESLCLLKISIFDQMPFESKLAELHQPDATGYDWRILHHFYEPLFQTGKIKTKFFIPGWESSTGARWEREQAVGRSIRIIDLDDSLNPIW